MFYIVFWLIESLYDNCVFIFILGSLLVLIGRLNLYRIIWIIVGIMIYMRGNKVGIVHMAIVIVIIYMYYYSILSSYILTEIYNILIYIVITII